MTEFYKNLVIQNNKYIPLKFKKSISKWLTKILTNEYKLYLMTVTLKKFREKNRLMDMNINIEKITKESNLTINKIENNTYLILMKIFLIVPVPIRKIIYKYLSRLYIFIKFKYAKIKWIT